LVATAQSPLCAQTYPFQDATLSFHERAVDLVSRLTLKEKIAQMGNMVDTKVSRDGIELPIYQYWNEALHGVARSGAATSFPESKAMSASWDRQLIFDCATATSDEARIYNNTQNKGLNYWCPTINMSRDPRWGRDEENYGEDPFLAGTLAVQFIRGMQGEQTADNPYFKTIACAKHFAANNYEQGRQGSTSYMKEHTLREYYLPAFEMAVKDGGVMSIMSSYNALSTDISETNAAGVKFGDAAAKGKAWGGKPNAMNDWLLTGILRNEWGFQGFVETDYYGVYGYQDSDRAVRNGNDACLTAIDTETNHLTDTESATSVKAMRQSAKNILFTTVNSRAYEPENLNTGLPVWVIVMIVVDVVLAALIVFLGFKGYKKYSKRVVVDEE
jgi:beta-glucosidase